MQNNKEKLRTKKAKDVLKKIEEGAALRRQVAFDFTRNAAIYARQSMPGQQFKYEQSYEEQTAGQRQKLIELGWSEERILEFYQDFELSGTLDIEDREGLSQLIAAIRERKISAVCAWMEDRLFRDEYLDNATRFARVCAENGVLLITERHVYDLADGLERERFLRECQYSWDAYERQIIQRLVVHKRLASRAGKYDGRTVPVGYTVCHDKDHKYYKRYIPLKEHAEIVVKWFERLRDLMGDFAKFCREVEAQEVHFPYVDDPFFNANNHLFSVPGGYKITSNKGVRWLITNRVYLGEWKFEGSWCKGNHLPIVSEELFEQVQALLELRKEKQPRLKYSTDYLLLKGLLRGPHGTYCTHHEASKIYEVNVQYTMISRIKLLSIRTEALDFAVRDRLFVKIRSTDDLSGYSRMADEAIDNENERRKELEESIASMQSQISRYELIMERAEKIGGDDMSATIDDYLLKIAGLRGKIKQKQAELDKPVKQVSFKPLLALINAIKNHWDEFDNSMHKELIRMSIFDIEIDYLSAHFLRLRVEWALSMWGVDECVIYRKQPIKKAYTDEDREFLRENYLTMDQNELVERIPNRTYAGISSYARYLGLPYREKRELKYPETLSIEDLQTMEKYNISAADLPLGKKGKGQDYTFTWFTHLSRESESPST